jgi:oligoribonuclease
LRLARISRLRDRLVVQFKEEALVTQSPQNLIWIDLEMTGLIPDQHRIIEIATVVTDVHLNILAEGPVLALRRAPEELAVMDDWNVNQHGHSGLIKRVRESEIDDAEAERQTIEFLEKWVPAGKSPMCGNSICQDRRFLARWMPALERFFHYRNLDVSTLKELCTRWTPEIARAYSKQSKHLALDDIKQSIEELHFYRNHFLRSPTV